MYFDYAATSLKRKDVLENLIENMSEYEANPSSIHTPGKRAKRYLEEAREFIANYINAPINSIYFTSGATESNNMVIDNFDDEDIEIITTNIEHKSILEPLKNIKSKVNYLRVDNTGKINIEQLVNSLNEKTKLVSIIYANNETGVIQDIKTIGAILKEKDIWFHVDAVQALGHIDIDIEEMNIDSLSLSGHKVGGFNGFGVLYLRKKIKNLIYGGSQEKGLRAGTSNVLGALSMMLSLKKMDAERAYVSELKKYFIEKLKLVPYEINGNIEDSVNHIVNIYFPFAKSDLLLTFLDLNKIYVSAGSACNSNTLEPSYVIENMYDKERAEHSIRFSFGFKNTKEEIDYLVKIIEKMYNKKKNI